MRRVLVTGASGALGSKVCRTLAANAYEIVGLDVVVRESKYVHRWIHTDMRSTNWQAAISGVDTVVHAAAFVHRAITSQQDRVNCFEINEQATLDLARSCAAAAVPLLLVSTVAVYGSMPLRRAVDEHYRCEPTSAYGQSKWAAEEGLRALGNSGLRFTILRFPLVYGPGGHGNMERMLRSILRRRYWPIRSQARKSCLFIEDASLAILEVTRQSAWNNDTYLVVPDGAPTVDQIQREAYNACGRWYPPPIPGLGARMAARSVDTVLHFSRLQSRLSESLGSLLQPAWCNGTKFSSHFGWSPRTALSNGLALTVGALKEVERPCN